MDGNRNEISDERVIEFVLAGQVIFAHKAILAGLMTDGDAAELLEMDTAHLQMLFIKLGLDDPAEELTVTFEEFLGPVPREAYFTADDITEIFLSEQDYEDMQR